MLALKLNHVGKRGPRPLESFIMHVRIIFVIYMVDDIAADCVITYHHSLFVSLSTGFPKQKQLKHKTYQNWFMRQSALLS